MRRVHALLVGIDAYRAPGLRPLHGCVNDIAYATAFLEPWVRDPLVLLDEKATRAAVVEGIETHLGAARPGDTALFWFSGHGSQAEVPDEYRRLEPSGTSQTLVCADSRVDGRPDLQDYELAALIENVARTGVHVVVVLDSCHSGGATRGDTNVRGVPPAPGAPAVESLVDAVRASATRDGGAATASRRRGNHVALTACQIHQTAIEYRQGGAVRGAFSTALLNAASTQGPGATYRELMVAARCAIEDDVADQHPLLYPAEHPIADQEFLGGASREPRSALVLRHVRDRWEINAGSASGLTRPDPDDPTLVGVVGEPGREARVTVVDAVSSEVEPVGWQPDRSRQYPVVLTRVPMPPTTVAVDGLPALADAIRRSPYVRLAEDGTPAELRVRTAPQVLDEAGAPLAPRVTGPDPVPTLLRELEHIARWRQVKKLRNTESRFAGDIAVEVAGPAGTLTPDAGGVIRLRYAPGPPAVSIRLHNRGDQRLFCALLDLTDRFQIHPHLFPGEYIEPGETGWAVDGRLVGFSLPPGRAAVPGAEAKDWLLLLASDQEFSSAAFTLGRLGEPAPDRTRSLPGLAGVLERLGLAALHRDAGALRPVPHDWTTSIVRVVTEVGANRVEQVL